METRARGRGDRTRTAGVGLTDAAFIDAHGDVLRAEPAYELQVDTVGKLLCRIPAGGHMQLQQVKVVNETHRMRVANLDPQRFDVEVISLSDGPAVRRLRAAGIDAIMYRVGE